MNVSGAIALVFACFGIGVPLFLGGWFSLMSCLLAIWACRKPNYYALGAIIINIINLLIVSPSKMDPAIDKLVLLGSFIYVYLAIILIQIIGIMIYVKNVSKNKKAIN